MTSAQASTRVSAQTCRGVWHALNRRTCLLLIMVAFIPTSFVQAGDEAERRPEPLLVAHTPTSPDTLTVPAGTPVAFELELPTGETWDTANVGRLVVRTYGVQDTIPIKPANGKLQAQYTFDKPGVALVMLCAGWGKDRDKSDAWQRTPFCTKLLLRITSADGKFPSAETIRDCGSIGKAGLTVEVLPYAVPWKLRGGHDLPLRVYFRGNKQKGAIVTAYKPDGTTTCATTDAKGITNISVDQPGRWVIRYERTENGVQHIGELVFEVPKETKHVQEPSS